MGDWNPYLRRESGLPGPRGNLELARAVAELAGPTQVEARPKGPDARAPENTPGVFVLICGVAALGRLIACGNRDQMSRLGAYAGDARWRLRQAAVIALQHVSDANIPALLDQMQAWAAGTWYKKRAVAATLAQPKILKSQPVVTRIVKILDTLMLDIAATTDPVDEPFKARRRTMGCAWSMVVAAIPSTAEPSMESGSSARSPIWFG